ncbi:hypothetical protein ACWDRB_60960 [Nonomuraea sp. NPDC003707]
MSHVFKALRKDYAEFLDLVDEQPGEFDIRAFCRAVGHRLNLTVELMFFDPAKVVQVGQPPLGCGDTGFYTRVQRPEEPGVIRDVIGYARNDGIPKWVQKMYISHELGHLIDYHAAGFDPVAAKDRLVEVFAPTLHKHFGDISRIRSIMGRSGFQSEEEARAEGFAGLLWERVEARPRRIPAQGGLLAHMTAPLVDPFRGA